MNWIDGIILLVIAIYVFEGIRRGFIEQTLELAGFVLTIFISTLFYKQVGNIIADKLGIGDKVAAPIGFFVVWFAAHFLYVLAMKLIYPRVPAIIRGALPNKLAGLVPALLKACVTIGVVMMMLVILPVPAKLKNTVGQSAVGSQFVKRSASIEAFVTKILGKSTDEMLTFLTVPSQNEQIIEPGKSLEIDKVADVTIDKDSEKKMFDDVNSERTKAGLKALVWDDKLTEVARAHSTKMFNEGYFSHTDPDGKSPFDRLEAAKISYQTAGENIAMAPTETLAHDGLMRSPGHRANILEKEFGHVGIGVIDGGIYGKMFTQLFTD